MTARPPRQRARVELLVAVALCCAGAALVLLSAGRPWAHVVVRRTPFPPLRVDAGGRSVDATVAALGLVGLAAVLALAAGRRRGRSLTGLLVVLAGLGIVWGAGRAALDPVPGARRAVADTAGASGSVHAVGTAWPWLAVAGGGLLLAAGGLAVARGRRWPALGSRYESPALSAPGPRGRAATVRSAPGAEAVALPAAVAAPTAGSGQQAATGNADAPADALLWDAFDRGEDPTG